MRSNLHESKKFETADILNENYFVLMKFYPLQTVDDLNKNLISNEVVTAFII